MYAELHGDMQKQRIKSLCDNILNYENDAALGLSCTETTRNAAANELYGKSFKDLSESQKQLTLLKMVEDANAASGALGQAARESDTWTNQLGNLKQSWTDFQAILGKKALPVAVNVVKKMAEGITNLTRKVPGMISKFKSFVGQAKEVGSYVGDKLQPIFTDLQTAFDFVKEAVTPIIDKFKEYFTSGQAVEDITNAVKSAADLLASGYQKIKDIITSVVDGFKDAVQWGKEHETGLALIATAIGTVTAAIVAYNVAQAIKKAGGIAEIAQLALLQVQLWGLSAAQAAQTVATTVATAATSAFGAVMSFVTSPITLVVLAIGALIAVGVLLYKNWDVVKEKALELWGKVTEVFGNLKESVSQKVDELKAAASEKWESMKAVASEKFESLKTAAVEKFESLKNSASEKWESMKTAASEKFESIKSKASEKFESMKNTVSEKASSLKDKVSTSWNNLKEKTSTAFENAKAKATEKFETLKNNVSEKATAAKEKISTAWDSIKTKTSTAFENARSKASSTWSSLKTSVSNFAEQTKSKVSSSWDSIKSKTSSAFSSAKSTASSMWSGIKTTISTHVSGAFSIVSDKFGAIKTKISSVMESAKSIVTGAVEKLKSAFSFNWKLPDLKLPHISVSGGEPPYGIAGKGSLPKFSIEWYKRAYNNPVILDSPSIFGYSAATGKFLGGGDGNGAEVVAGANTLMNMIGSTVAMQNADLAVILYKILDAILLLDENMGGHMREALAGTSFEINRREFARLVKAVN